MLIIVNNCINNTNTLAAMHLCVGTKSLYTTRNIHQHLPNQAPLSECCLMQLTQQQLSTPAWGSTPDCITVTVPLYMQGHSLCLDSLITKSKVNRLFIRSICDI